MKILCMLYFVIFSIISYSTDVFSQRLSPLEAQEARQHKINLNQADAETLKGSFKGIGEKRAQAIVRYRERYGEFRSIFDLARIKGISLRFIQKNLSQLETVFTL